MEEEEEEYIYDEYESENFKRKHADVGLAERISHSA